MRASRKACLLDESRQNSWRWTTRSKSKSAREIWSERPEYREYLEVVLLMCYNAMESLLEFSWYRYKFPYVIIAQIALLKLSSAHLAGWNSQAQHDNLQLQEPNTTRFENNIRNNHEIISSSSPPPF